MRGMRAAAAAATGGLMVMALVSSAAALTGSVRCALWFAGSCLHGFQFAHARGSEVNILYMPFDDFDSAPSMPCPRPH